MPISISHLVFSHSPNDPVVFDDVTASISGPRTGIIGRNGSGKSTLLALIAGELTPTSGEVAASGRVARLRQDLVQRADVTVADLLGISERLAALRRIEAGSIDLSDYDTLGDDWDIEARALAVIAQRAPSVSLEGVLDRSTLALSGGEVVQLGLAAVELDGAPIALLDEPTNNLDAAARDALYAAVEAWPSQVVVVSHDVTLLNLMDQIVEVSPMGLDVYGGNYEFATAEREKVREAALREVRDSRQALRAERRDFQQVQTATARQERHDKAKRQTKPGTPRTSDPTAKRAAQARRAERVRDAASHVREAAEKLDAARSLVRDDDSIRIEIVDPRVPSGRRIAELVGSDGRRFVLAAPERWALVGGNGVGKTTLLRTLLGISQPTPRPAASGRLLTDRVGYLDQRLTLDDAKSAFELVSGAAPQRLPHDTYEGLARFLLRGDAIHRPARTLSGGERFRVALARVLLAVPPPELLVLDEPTNNLDLDSLDQLVDALGSYRGALIIVSHDRHLLSRLGLDRILDLSPDGTLRPGEIGASPSPESPPMHR